MIATISYISHFTTRMNIIYTNDLYRIIIVLVCTGEEKLINVLTRFLCHIADLVRTRKVQPSQGQPHDLSQLLPRLCTNKQCHT